MCPSHLGLLASTGLGAGFVQGRNSHYSRKRQPHAWASGLLFQSTMDVHSLARGLAYSPRDSGKSVNDIHVPRSHAGVWTPPSEPGKAAERGARQGTAQSPSLRVNNACQC